MKAKGHQRSDRKERRRREPGRQGSDKHTSRFERLAFHCAGKVVQRKKLSAITETISEIPQPLDAAAKPSATTLWETAKAEARPFHCCHHKHTSVGSDGKPDITNMATYILDLQVLPPSSSTCETCQRLTSRATSRHSTPSILRMV